MIKLIFIICQAILFKSNQQTFKWQLEEIIVTFAESKVTSPENVIKKDHKGIMKEVINHFYLGPRVQNQTKCYNCQGLGHMARECPSERQQRPERH